MSEEEDKSVDLVPRKNGDVIEMYDPSTTKREALELEVEEVKAGLQDIARTGKDAIDDLASLAKSSQHPRLYEALANTIKAINDTHRELNNVLITKSNMLNSSTIKDDPVVNQTNNNLFVTSTEMLQMIKKKSNG